MKNAHLFGNQRVCWKNMTGVLVLEEESMCEVDTMRITLQPELN